MRLLFVALVGAIGWLWFAVRAPAEPPPAPDPYVRRADLTGLGAQVAAARSAVIPAAPADVGLDETVEEEPDEETELEVEEQVLLAIFDRPPPTDAIDLSQRGDYHEVIVIDGRAPPIDDTTVTRGGLARTFEGALGAAADTFDDEPVSFSSGSPVENTYEVDEPAIARPLDERIEEIEALGGSIY